MLGSLIQINSRRKIVEKIIVAFILLWVTVGGCTTLNRWIGLSNDNLAENLVEDAIELQSGKQVDLTPQDVDTGPHLYPRKDN
jgi:hypothetical protein